MVDQQEILDYWLSGSIKDRQTARHMFAEGHYDWSLFVYQLSIEKLLKAILVHLGKEPPKSHNLNLLAKKANINFADDMANLVDEINTFNLEARYDDYKFNFHKKANKHYSTIWIQNCNKVYLWLNKQFLMIK